MPHCEAGSQQPRGISLTQPELDFGPYVRPRARGWFATFVEWCVVVVCVLIVLSPVFACLFVGYVL